MLPKNNLIKRYYKSHILQQLIELQLIVTRSPFYHSLELFPPANAVSYTHLDVYKRQVPCDNLTKVLESSVGIEKLGSTKAAFSTVNCITQAFF